MVEIEVRVLEYTGLKRRGADEVLINSMKIPFSPDDPKFYPFDERVFQRDRPYGLSCVVTYGPLREIEEAYYHRDYAEISTYIPLDLDESKCTKQFVLTNYSGLSLKLVDEQTLQVDYDETIQFKYVPEYRLQITLFPAMEEYIEMYSRHYWN